MSKQFQRDFGVYCCPHIFHKEKPVLLVIRDEDWQFLCGNDVDDECHYVGVGHLLDRDNSLEVLINLEKNTGAKRDDTNQAWKYFNLD
ncbi:hypothetical protein ACWL9T_001435 [Acinetobacter baumannii]|uniref:hypothetical protein n=1 Tax=Acinetobacter baumannii TaxID=470 RepID=UPI0018648DAA|nr:hypothetical protein [Acinetobacter baumannii]EJG9768724.1 hypothetical protein [Acinetobacter baumannii]EJR7361516.1 hypothetical protein [Acinetobacter baumannii]EKT7940060.1 hypothetical protein [Acinetobacter baumannii]EKT8089982.1 hypothetical protein [Acinetobacter baumannii]EKT8288325.1 hypothetical protein [Acinetobacter baumannii]